MSDRPAQPVGPGSGSGPPSPAPSDEELMVQVVAGRQAAFEELFDRYRRPVASLCLRFLHNRDQTEAAAQETFLRLLQHRDKYQPGHRVSTWILSIAANLCRDLLKRKDRATLDGLEEMGLQLADRSLNPHDGVERAEQADRLAAAVQQLDPIFREIIILRVFQDLSYKEISELIACNESTARSRMELAIKQLRRLLAGKKASNSKRGRPAKTSGHESNSRLSLRPAREPDE